MIHEINETEKIFNETIQELALTIQKLLDGNALPDIHHDSLEAVMYIFSVVMSAKIIELQDKENMSVDNRKDMIIAFGKEMERLLKIYANKELKHIYHE